MPPTAAMCDLFPPDVLVPAFTPLHIAGDMGGHHVPEIPVRSSFLGRVAQGPPQLGADHP